MVNIWDDIHQFQGLAYQPFVLFRADTSADVSSVAACHTGSRCV